MRQVDASEPLRPGVAWSSGRLHHEAGAGGFLNVLILLFVAAGTLATVAGGPALGEHEAIVAQCARDMRTTGNWLVPHYLGEPYVRKPPLPYWLIAGLSYLFPDDARTGLPVTTSLARLPSALAAFGTVLLLWRLAAIMFGRLTGRVTAVIAASSLFFLLYAPNATVEMLLTFCCVWAHVHFWCALRHPPSSSRRLLHLFFFYVALGVGMMAKGPFPLVMVALPIAMWWYTERPLRLLAQQGPRGWRAALTSFFRRFGPQTWRAVTQLWLLPGLVVFALCFVPWMIAVGRRHPDAWDLWNWQYWQRAQGQYEDTKSRGPFYYVPVAAGLVLPWLFLLFEAVIAPWIRKYALQRRGLLYAGLWALVGLGIMSAMSFKKPYYVAPMIPALLLLIGPVAVRFYLVAPRVTRLAWWLWGVLAIGAIGGVAGGHFWLHHHMPDLLGPLTLIAALMAVLIVTAGFVYLRGYRWTAFATTAATSILVFNLVWYGCGRAIDNVDKVADLARLLDQLNPPADARILWAERRQDPRLSFYFKRYTEQMIQPAEIVQQFVDRTARKDSLKFMAIDRAQALLGGSEPVYLILDRKSYQMARMTGLSDKAHLLGEAKDPDSARSDWLVISNVAPTTPASSLVP